MIDDRHKCGSEISTKITNSSKFHSFCTSSTEYLNNYHFLFDIISDKFHHSVITRIINSLFFLG